MEKSFMKEDIIKKIFEKGGLLIKHPTKDKFLVKGNAEIYNLLRENKIDYIICEKENNLNIQEIQNLFDDLSIKYKIDKVLLSYHPLLCMFLIISDDEIDEEDLISFIISRTSIIRGGISINNQPFIFFSANTSTEDNNKDIERDIISNDDIINLKILLNTVSNFNELIEKL